MALVEDGSLRSRFEEVKVGFKQMNLTDKRFHQALGLGGAAVGSVLIGAIEEFPLALELGVEVTLLGLAGRSLVRLGAAMGWESATTGNNTIGQGLGLPLPDEQAQIQKQIPGEEI
jgi:hypothetical protein